MQDACLSSNTTSGASPEGVYQMFRELCMCGIQAITLACAEAMKRMQVQVILYFIMLHLLSFFGLAALIHALKPNLEWLMGRLTGTTCCTSDILTPTSDNSQGAAHSLRESHEHCRQACLL